MAIDLSTTPSRRKAVAWHVAGGWTSNAILIVQGFLLIPLYLAFLGERLYGFWLASGGLLAWMAMVDVGGAAITKVRGATAYGKKDLQGVVDYFWHGAVVMAGVVALYLVFVLGLAAAVPRWLGADADWLALLAGCFRLAGMAGALALANNFLRDFASALQRTSVPSVLQAVGDLLSLATVVVCLVLLGMGLWSIPVSILARNVFVFAGNALHAAAVLRSTGKSCAWTSVVFGDYLRTTPSILVAKASGSFAANLPNILLTKLLGPESAVAYTVTIRLMQVAQQFINNGLAASYAAYSHLFGDASVGEGRKRILLRDFARGFMGVTACAVAGFILLDESFVGLWTSADQFVGREFTALAGLAAFMILRSRLLMGMLFSAGAMQPSGYVSSFENILQAGLMLGGVYLYGITGIPLAVIISGLATQALYHRAFRHKDTNIASGLLILQWAWLPVGAAAGAAFALAGYCHFATWVGLIAGAIAIGGVLSVGLLAGVPVIRRQLFDFVGKSVNAVRRAYLKRRDAGAQSFFNGQVVVPFTGLQAGNDLIAERIRSGEPFMVARHGRVELRYLYERSQARLRVLCNNAGFFPPDPVLGKRFIQSYEEASREIDLLALVLYRHGYLPEEQGMFQRFSPGASLIDLACLSPFLFERPWSAALAGKRVLVVHPFAGTIRSQYENHRGGLFANGSVLPELGSLEVVRAVQSIGGGHPVHPDWFAALEAMQTEIDARDYDVALLGCGAYGLPLAAHIKRSGKQAIYLGGVLQLLFGIRGRRWEGPPYNYNQRFYNSHWVRPAADETPAAAAAVEGGCYW